MNIPIRMFFLTLFLCLIFTVTTQAQDNNPVPSVVPAEQRSEPEEPKEEVQSVVPMEQRSDPVAAAKPAEKPRPFFSGPWFGICILASGTGFVFGKVSGTQEGAFSTFLLDNVIASLPDDMEIEYEFSQVSSGRVKFIVRILLKQQDGTGKLTTMEKELNWHDVPSEIRADLIRSKSQNHVRSLKKMGD